MHVGEPEYYRALQKFLDAQTVVLYEGINTDSHPRHVGDATGSAGGVTAEDIQPKPRFLGTRNERPLFDAVRAG